MNNDDIRGTIARLKDKERRLSEKEQYINARLKSIREEREQAEKEEQEIKHKKGLRPSL